MIEWLLAHWTEVLGFATGALCVVLAGRRNVWNYPIGIANNLVFIVLFASSGLYAATGLQVVYLAFGVHGWWRWTRGAEHDRGFIARTPRRQVPWLVLAGVGGTVLLWWVLATFTDSQVALADTATTAASLVAQYLLNRKRIENWAVWIAVDIAFVGLAIATGLWITAVLYAGFIVICAVSWRSWLRVEREQRQQRGNAPDGPAGAEQSDATDATDATARAATGA
ncbi:nicotinamide riboside transporter PnuC [Agromyces sp. LHK192]|uniref:nicotinamide riboside transporter PnuC n=1 Tax=Agromyces sp. LHK192 TaxID=2498704 RepID=UPI000FDCBB44|nr:nicotinamide riboside transporter PnuC [Agromyces sp. LHK192]